MRAIRKMQRVILALFILTLLAFCGLRIYRRLTVDVTPPVITCSTDSIDVSVTAGEEALLQGVMASDDRDGDLTDQILIKGVSPSLTDSSAQVTYIVFDSANNMATVTRTVRYTDYEAPRFALSQPLVYPAGQTVTLLDRLTASDVLDGDISSGIRITSQNVINSQPGVYSVTAQQLGETNLIRVTVTADTPRQALVLLKAVSDNYGSLSAHVSSTAVLSQLNSPSLSVAPSRSYNVPRICLMAAIAGAALTALGVAWASVSSGTVQTQEGARSDLDAKIISTVPHEGRRTRKLLGWFDDRRRERRARRGGKRLRRNLNISSPAISFAFTESIHRIAEKFQHEHAKGRRVFLFSSVSAAEGKSTLAANTAISLASRGVNVLFIDLDLRRPVQSEMLGLSVKQKNELGTLLTESAAPEKILAAAVTDPATGLHSLLSTKSYTDVIELLASDQLAKVVALARERYDYVIIDSPPLGFFSDSELLSDLSDASVLVVRQDTVPAPEINDAIDALRAGKAEFLGCILNDMAHLAAWSSGYGYGYGKKYDKYGYGQHSARKTQ